MTTDSKSEILHDLSPSIRIYKDGTVDRLIGKEITAASVDPETGVRSKDVKISPELNVSARLYQPENGEPGRKLPILVYFHGGGFLLESAFSTTYHAQLNAIVAEAKVLAVSVDYRLAPENPLPIAYEDSWLALKWVASHSKRDDSPEEWLKNYADFDRVVLAGDSAGGNLAHNMALKVGVEKLEGVNLQGIFLNCPYFWGEEPIGAELANLEMKALIEAMWKLAYPNTIGFDDPLLNPLMEPKLSSLGCKRVLVYVAEKDVLKDRGWHYKDALEKSEWDGEVEVVEVAGADHVIDLFSTKSDNALSLLKKLASFISQNAV